MSDDHVRNNETGQREAVADLLHNRTSGAESRRSDIRATEIVDNDANSYVCARDDALRAKKRSGVHLGVTHLGRDGEESRRSGKGEDEGRNGRDTLGKVGALDKGVVGLPVTSLGRGSRSVLNTDGDGDTHDWLNRVRLWGPRGRGNYQKRLTGCHDADKTDPSQPTDLSECSNTGKAETNYSGHGNKNSRASTVR